MSVLRDTAIFSGFKLTEGVTNATTGRKPLVVEGVFQRADVLNANHRVYPKALWEKVLTNSSLKEALNNRRMFGEVDHPADWRMALARTSHVITDLKMDESGNIIGKAEILPTPTGLVLEAILRAGCEVGISSRGTGSTSSTNEGHEVVGEDYQLETFDFVATPSTPGAYPKMVMETMERAQAMEARIMDSLFKSVTPAKKEEVNEMSLDGYRALEREASELIRIKVKGIDAATRTLVLNKIEETMGKVIKAGEADKTVAVLSESMLKSLEKKRSKLSPVTEEDVLPQETNVPDYSSAAADKLEDDGDDDADDKEADDEKSSKEENRAMKKFNRLFTEDDDMPEFLKKKADKADGKDSDDKDEAEEVSSADSNSPMEDEETAGEVTSDINAEIPNVSAESIDRRVSAFLREEMPDNFKKDDDKDSDDDDDKDEDAASEYSPEKPVNSSDDIVTATESDIRGLMKVLSKNPAKLESFIRGTIKMVNAERKARRVSEAKAIKFGKVAEAVIKRHKKASKVNEAAGPLAAKYKFVCEAVAELQRRYFSLKNKFLISEALIEAGVPSKERAEWVQTLSTLTTREQLVRGIQKVKALYTEEDEKPSDDKKDDEQSDEKSESTKQPKPGAENLSESKDKHDIFITEGAAIFANARSKRGLR